MVLKFQYLVLEGQWYIKFVTWLSEGGTQISVPSPRETVVPKFQYHALEGRWY